MYLYLNLARFYLEIVQDFTNYSFLTETRNKHITVSRGFKKNVIASPPQIPGYAHDSDIYVQTITNIQDNKKIYVYIVNIVYIYILQYMHYGSFKFFIKIF